MSKIVQMDRRLIYIGEHIRKLRKRRDLNQELFAEKLDLSCMTVSRIENGVTPMNILILLRMSEILDVSVDHILNPETMSGQEKIKI